MTTADERRQALYDFLAGAIEPEDVDGLAGDVESWIAEVRLRYESLLRQQIDANEDMIRETVAAERKATAERIARAIAEGLRNTDEFDHAEDALQWAARIAREEGAP